MNKVIQLFALMLITGASTCAFSQTEDLAAAVANGKVSVTFQGLGGSSGDTIQADIRATSKAGGERILGTAHEQSAPARAHAEPAPTAAQTEPAPAPGHTEPEPGPASEEPSPPESP